jgi:hypothetical protein
MTFNFKKSVLDKFSQLAFPNIVVDEENENVYVKREGNDIYILETLEDERVISFYSYNEDDKAFNLRSDISSIRFDKDFDISQIISVRERSYKVSFGWQIKSALNIDSEIKTVLLKSRYRVKRTDNRKKAFLISTDKYLEVFNDVVRIERIAKSYRSSTERYLLNELKLTHAHHKVGDTTSISKGEFEFLVHKLNLRTKRKKADLDKYLNTDDKSSLQSLFTALIRHSFFDPDFLRRLNNYFIKENLKDIIELGEKILNLGSSNLDTEKAKQVVNTVANRGKAIKKLEELWQVYFEKYLLFLIFSYREIYPKVELTDIEGDKKYPDFLGINHYNGLDVIEIKTHLKRALTYDKSHKNYGFSAELSKAIIQTMNYMDAIIHMRFKNRRDRKKITNTIHDENLNRPRGIIIISSMDKLATNVKPENQEDLIRDFTKLRNSLHNIEILTFDEVLKTATNYLENIVGRTES